MLIIFLSHLGHLMHSAMPNIMNSALKIMSGLHPNLFFKVTFD